MSSHLMRVASFATCPSIAAVSSLVLARAGFKYTGHGESTVCTECQLVVDRWQQGDLPDQVHRQRSPNCAFVREHLHASDSNISSPIRPTASGAAVESRSSFSLTCNIDRTNPDFERLKNEEARLMTFYDWPERAARIVEPRDLARAGFFYTGQIDRVQCAFCRGCLHSWVQGDRADDEHRRHFPNCPSVKQQLKDVGRIPEYVCQYISVTMLLCVEVICIVSCVWP